jgi:competence protein ComEC
VYVVLLLLAGFWSDAWNRRGGRAVKLALALIVIALHLGTPPPGPGGAARTVIDVGQGLAVAMRGTDGGFVLVDAGPAGNGRVDAGDRIVVPALVTAGCRRLEVLALSHDHDDHAGGALAVLRDLDVGELWVGAGTERDPLTRVVAAEAVARGVALRRLLRGDRFLRAGLEFVALHPGVLDRFRTPNDRCLVLRAAADDGATLLLPGDLEATGERAMLAAGSDPRADVLVAPHHGANGSSSAEFLARVAPRYVVVSAGEGNRFGHPGAAALARMAAVSARVWRTDRDGSVTLDETGGAWRISVERDRGRDERQDEHDGQDDGEHDPSRPERLGLIPEVGMPPAQDQQDPEP